MGRLQTSPRVTARGAKSADAPVALATPRQAAVGPTACPSWLAAASCMLLLASPSPSAADGAGDRAAPGQRASELSLFAGGAAPRCSGGCPAPKLGWAAGIEAFLPMGRWFRAGFAVDAVNVGYDQRGEAARETLLLAPIILRGEPVQGGVDVILDLGFGLASRGAAGLAGVGVEAHATRQLRFGPALRIVGIAGGTVCSAGSSLGGGSECASPVIGALLLTVGATWVFPSD